MEKSCVGDWSFGSGVESGSLWRRITPWDCFGGERESFPRTLVIQGALTLNHDGDGHENV